MPFCGLLSYITAQLVPDFAIRNSCGLTPLSFWHAPIHFAAIAYFWHQRCSRLLLYFSVPILKSTTSPWSPGFFYGKMVFRNQNLNPRYAISIGKSLLLGPLSRDRKHMCIYSNPHTHKHLYFSSHLVAEREREIDSSPTSQVHFFFYLLCL